MLKSRNSYRSAESHAQTRLLMREWALILGIFGILISSIVVSQLSKVHHAEVLQTCIIKADRPIAITLTGAIKRPGTYQVKPGTTLKDLLKEIPLADDATRKKVQFKKVFYASQSVHIPKKERTTLED